MRFPPPPTELVAISGTAPTGITPGVGVPSNKPVTAWVNGGPLVLIENGHLHRDRMKRVRIAEDDVMQSARQSQGLERPDQVKHAVLERAGGISFVPR